MERAKLAAARYDEGLSQEKLAECVGVTRSTISQWERGLSHPYPIHVKRLCKLFGKNAEDLDLGAQYSSAQTAGKEEKQDNSSTAGISHTYQRIVPIQDMEDDELVDRRKATKTISAFSLALFTSSLEHASHALHSEEILSICATNIPICWRLYFDGHLLEVQQILFPVYLPQLILLAQKSGYQRGAADLASKASLLAAIIEMHYQNFGNALAHAKQGVLYGELAEDLNLQIASLIQRANIYFSLKQPWKELEAYQQAHQIYQNTKYPSNTKYPTISPLLEGRVYIGLAKAYGHFKKEQETLRFLGMAHEIYPEHPEADQAFNYTYHSRFTLNNHTGLTYLNLDQAQSAWDIFTELDKSIPTKLVPRRAELLIRQATTSFALDNMQECCTYLESAITGAITLGSDLRLNEAYLLYLSMYEKWGKEHRVKLLGKYFNFPD